MSDPAPLDLELAEAPAQGRALWLQADGARIRAAVWAGGDRGTALIFNGRTEYIEKYGRVIHTLQDRGFSVATLDWRGQGLSDRPLDNPMKGHVGDFTEYQRDIDAFLAAPEVAALPGPRLLLCHSMGGCIGLRALVEGRVRPAASVMSAPMLGIGMSGMQKVAAPLLTGAARVFGMEETFTPDPKPEIAYVAKTGFADNLLTSDPEYYAFMQHHVAAQPGFALGPPTVGWLARALDETRALAAAPPPDSPVLALLGTDEQIVSPEAIRAFAAGAPNAELMELPGARHECLMETPKTRDAIWSRVDAFLDGLI